MSKHYQCIKGVITNGALTTNAWVAVYPANILRYTVMGWKIAVPPMGLLERLEDSPCSTEWIKVCYKCCINK